MRIEEFMKKIDDVTKKYPAESEKALEFGARAMRRALIKNSPVGKYGPDKLRISKNWKVAYEYRGRESVAKIRNKSPHYHLVERGHRIVDRKGRTKGFQQGQFFTKKTVANEGEAIKQRMTKKLYRLLKDKL